MTLRPPGRARAVGVLTAFVAGVLVVGSAAVPPPARASAAAPPVATEVDLRLSRPQAITGESVDLRITVAPAVARPVVLQRRAGDRWVEVTRGRTDTSGIEVLTRSTPRAGTTYRVRAPRTDRAGTTYAADVSPARVLAVQRQEVYLRLPESAVAGERPWAFVECFPHRPGRAVELWQRFEGGAWRSVATGVQDDRGMLRLEALVPEAGDYQRRAVVAAAKGAAEASSPARHLTVTAPP